VSSLGENIQEVFVSVLTRKQPASDASGIRGHTMYAARHVGPLAQQAAQQVAQQAMPYARNAGDSIRQSTDGAMAWAAPKVDAARHWAAPQLEQYAHAISENLAPTISSALISAAHKIDVKPKKSKGRRQAVITGALLTAAAGAAAVFVTRRWHSADAYTASGEVSGLGPAADGQPAPERGYEANGGPADQDINGNPRIL
jgi:hypothetical protein